MDNLNIKDEGDMSLQHVMRSDAPKKMPPRKKHKLPSTKKHRSPVDEDEDEDGECVDDEEPLPMPHNGDAPEEEEEPSIVHIPNPMWEELFHEKGQRPVDRRHCWGCQFGRLEVTSLPYEGYTRLCNDLPNKIIQHGFSVAVDWAGSFFDSSVRAYITASPEVLARTYWSGISIVWHFCKHTHMAQFTALVETLELEYANRFLMENKLFMRPVFGDASDKNVDPSTVRTLSYIRTMLQKQRTVDPQKWITFHQGMGATSKEARTHLAAEKFTGRGCLHK